MNSWVKSLPLKMLGEIVSGSTPSTHVKEYWDGDIPWVTPADLTRHSGIYFKGKLRKITQAGFKSCSTRMLPPGSILFSSRAPIGHCAVTVYPLCTNQGFKSIIPNAKLDPNYGFFALKYFTPMIVSMGRGATFAEISKDLFGDFEIPVPPRPEQQRIAGILEKADRVRRLRRHALELGDTYLQSVFLEIFGDPATNPMMWSKKNIGDLAEVKTGGTPSREKSAFYGGSIPWVKTTEVIGSIIYDSEEKISQDGLRASNCEIFPPETILIAMYGQGLTRGRSAKLGISASTNQACAAILPSTRINTDYLWTYLKLSYNRIRDLGRGGNQPNLNLSMVRNFEVPVPPLSSQEQFAYHVQRYERLRFQHREAERQAEHLFQTLLHRAFRGEV